MQMVRGVMSPREMEMPRWTFLNWYRHIDYTAYPFNTQPMARSPCQRPFIYNLSSVRYNAACHTTITMYEQHHEVHLSCGWKMDDPSAFIDRIIVPKKSDPLLWDRSSNATADVIKLVKFQYSKLYYFQKPGHHNYFGKSRKLKSSLQAFLGYLFPRTCTVPTANSLGYDHSKSISDTIIFYI
ncbi:hypothetical protein COCNU_scaffold012148G000010 [Cocos nucifera]|nr:hypothetical protein [Cocos nucifera]